MLRRKSPKAETNIFWLIVHSHFRSYAHFIDSANVLKLDVMSDRRTATEANGRAKRQKTSDDPAANPYLAHMYPEEGGNDYENGYSNGYGSNSKAASNGSGQGGLRHFKRHATTAAQAHTAEDGPSNPFNGAPLSERYFGILKTRRNLPVHVQRFVATSSQHRLCTADQYTQR